MVIKKNNKLPDYQSFVDYSAAINKNNPVPQPNDVTDSSKVISNKKPLPSPQNNLGQISDISSFQKVFVINDWQEDNINNRFIYNISRYEHDKGSNIIYNIYELTNDGLVSVLLEDFIIDDNSDIQIVSNIAFDGKIIIK